MAVHIGTSGSSYDHWDGVLYPPGTPPRDRLAHSVRPTCAGGPTGWGSGRARALTCSSTHDVDGEGRAVPNATPLRELTGT